MVLGNRGGDTTNQSVGTMSPPGIPVPIPQALAWRLCVWRRGSKNGQIAGEAERNVFIDRIIISTASQVRVSKVSHNPIKHTVARVTVIGSMRTTTIGNWTSYVDRQTLKGFLNNWRESQTAIGGRAKGLSGTPEVD